MKKLLATLVLTITLAFGVFSQDSPTRKLGQGFESRDRQVEGQTVRLVKFPARCWITGPSRYGAYNKCLDQAIEKVFRGQKAKFGKQDNKFYVLVGKNLYRIGPLGDYVDGEVTVVGISLYKVGSQQERYF